MPGFDDSRVTVTDNGLQLNWQGLVYDPGNPILVLRRSASVGAL
jgi:hypothetical protein